MRCKPLLELSFSCFHCALYNYYLWLFSWRWLRWSLVHFWLIFRTRDCVTFLRLVIVASLWSRWLLLSMVVNSNWKNLMVRLMASFRPDSCPPLVPLGGLVFLVLTIFTNLWTSEFILIEPTSDVFQTLTLSPQDCMDVYVGPMEKDGIFWVKLSVLEENVLYLNKMAHACR